jgi:hypothetical protein
MVIIIKRNCSLFMWIKWKWVRLIDW